MNRKHEWWMNHNQVYGLAAWLVNEGIINDCIGLLYVFEKPWKYEEEYKEWCNATL